MTRNLIKGTGARFALLCVLMLAMPLAWASAPFPVAQVLARSGAPPAPAAVVGRAWLNDYRAAMNDARSGFAYALVQPLANLKVRLDGMAGGAPGGAKWIAVNWEDELVGLLAPTQNLRQDILRGHINPQPVQPLLVAGAVQVTWLPRAALKQALNQAEDAIAAHASGIRVWQLLRAGLTQVRKEFYLQDADLLRAYGFLEAAEAKAPLNYGAASPLLLRASAALRGDASSTALASSLHRLATQGNPRAYAIGAVALRLKNQITRRAFLWFVRPRMHPGYSLSLSLKGISASSS